jgi:hypothetical protein
MTWVIAISVGLHGVSVTPLMSWYERTLVRKPKYHH